MKINVRWLNRYNKFINSRKNRKLIKLFEKHHIKPQSIFPELKNDINNIINLSFREHYIAHYMLAKTYGGTLWFALHMMKSKYINIRLHKVCEIESLKIKKMYMPVFNLDTNQSEYILIKNYNNTIHMTPTRKKTSMPNNYLFKLDVYEFNLKYNQNIKVENYNILTYKKELHKLRSSISQKGNKNNSILSRNKISTSLKLHYKTHIGNNTGIKASIETKIKMSESAKNRKTVSRKKQFNLISPNGIIYLCDGNLKKTVIGLNLSLTSLNNNRDQIVPKSNSKNKIRINTTGWKLETLH